MFYNRLSFFVFLQRQRPPQKRRARDVPIVFFAVRCYSSRLAHLSQLRVHACSLTILFIALLVLMGLRSILPKRALSSPSSSSLPSPRSELADIFNRGTRGRVFVVATRVGTAAVYLSLGGTN